MIHLLPQCPLKNRYTEDWISMWERELREYGIVYDTIGSSTPLENVGLFDNMPAVIDYELNQIRQVEDIVRNGEVKNILHLDIDFPGIFAGYAQLLKWRKPNIKLFGYCHAGSWNNKDIFADSKGKKEIELAVFKCFDKIFVATEYHKNNIEKYFNQKFDNIKVVGLPFYEHDCTNYLKGRVLPFHKKDVFLISGRLEQSDRKMIDKLKEKYSEYNWVDFTSDDLKHSRKDYFELLNRTRISISFNVEETFGLSQFEVASFGGLTLSPNKYSYPEIIPHKELLYDNEDDLFNKFEKLLELDKNPYPIPMNLYSFSIAKMLGEIYNEDF